MKINIPHKILLPLSLFVALGTVIIYIYMQVEIKSSLNRVIQGQRIARVEEMKIGQEKMMMKVYDTTIEDRKKINSLFVSTGQEVSFIETLESLGTKTGSKVTISAVTSDSTKSVTADGYAKISAHVEAIGSWTNVIRFLKLSETLGYQAQISNVRLDSSGNSSQTSGKAWKLSFDISSRLKAHEMATSTIESN